MTPYQSAAADLIQKSTEHITRPDVALALATAAQAYAILDLAASQREHTVFLRHQEALAKSSFR